ncbi:NAD-P-binding protein [Laetiporus sulphureus 93-53]|uniref:NAD-P-binding protein n=1 Tax=Laetiporus sulphureus 93-53 TaxID=1314785 RepID=A0A165DKI5_9APHY|nr:NAD-P-binding protein [Laetiporus sulphureus 93-53]KZT05083.1 NAD-P-binding protein [Laetiporus sulphureus 93-53]
MTSNALADPEQKVWFITGTSSGFGRRLVTLVLARGDYVIGTVRRAEDFQVSVFETDRTRLHVIVLDLKDEKATMQEKVREAVSVWGRIDVLVNNAAWAPKSLLEEGGTSFVLDLFQTNVFGVLNLTNAVLPYMRERKSGTVVFFGSRSVWKADTILTGHYIATKGAIHALAETYAAELEPFNVRVVLAAPGGFRTENIHTAPIISEHQMSAYDDLRETELAIYHERWRQAPGDPVKAMELLIDVVKKEGKAEGREIPFYLILGSPTYEAARAHCGRLLQVMDQWEDVAKDLEFDADV